MKKKAADIFIKAVGLPTVTEYVADIIETGEVQCALDIGCGFSSHLTRFRPKIKTVGIDGHESALEDGRSTNAHDHYVLADILKLSLDDIQNILEKETGRRTFDLVSAFGLIEHLPKKSGWDLLQRCEELSSKFVIIDTPNGYVPQGPEFGNPYQRHLSGWYPHELRSMAYDVYGNAGTRYFRGYMGMKKLPIPGLLLFDQVMARVLLSNKFPQHGYNLTAVKDVRGVEARFPTRSDWSSL